MNARPVFISEGGSKQHEDSDVSEHKLGMKKFPFQSNEYDYQGNQSHCAETMYSISLG